MTVVGRGDRGGGWLWRVTALVGWKWGRRWRRENDGAGVEVERVDSNIEGTDDGGWKWWGWGGAGPKIYCTRTLSCAVISNTHINCMEHTDMTDWPTNRKTWWEPSCSRSSGTSPLFLAGPYDPYSFSNFYFHLTVSSSSVFCFLLYGGSCPVPAYLYAHSISCLWLLPHFYFYGSASMNPELPLLLLSSSYLFSLSYSKYSL